MDKFQVTDAIGGISWWMVLIAGSVHLKHITPVNTKEFWVITLVFIALSIISFMRGTLYKTNLKIKKYGEEEESTGKTSR